MTGVEFSCKDENGKYHILGYGYDPEAQAVQSLVEKSHSFRLEKVHARLAFLRDECLHRETTWRICMTARQQLSWQAG